MQKILLYPYLFVSVLETNGLDQSYAACYFSSSEPTVSTLLQTGTSASYLSALLEAELWHKCNKNFLIILHLSWISTKSV